MPIVVIATVLATVPHVSCRHRCCLISLLNPFLHECFTLILCFPFSAKRELHAVALFFYMLIIS